MLSSTCNLKFSMFLVFPVVNYKVNLLHGNNLLGLVGCIGVRTEWRQFSVLNLPRKKGDLASFGRSFARIDQNYEIFPILFIQCCNLSNINHTVL